MKERYNRFMNNIVPEASDDDLFRAVLANADKRKKIKTTEKKILKKAVIIPIAAVMTLTLSIAGGAAIYNGLSYLRTSEIAQSPKVAQNIQTEVFSDSTEHIKMTVEEYVSDGISAYATVKYEALDDYGRNWLLNKKFEHAEFCLLPCTVQYGSEYAGVSHSFGNFEIEEMRTENERYFYIELNCNGDDYDGDIALLYPMSPYDSRETPFEKCNVEISNYELSGNEQASKYFTPTYLRISDLSFTLYGMNHGTYTKVERTGYYGVHSTIPEEERDEVYKSTQPTLIMKNRERIQLESGWALGDCKPAEKNFYSDLVISSSNFTKLNSEQNKWINYSMEIGEIAGVEINGAYFTATKIE